MTGSGSLGASYAGLNASSSPVNYTIPAGFTPPVDLGGGGVAPYTVASGGHWVDNSPSRLNVAKAGIAAVLNTYMANVDFAMIDYQKGGATLYNTMVYEMSPSLSDFTFTTTAGPSEVANPCYQIPQDGANNVDSSCLALAGTYGAATLFNDAYMNVSASSDDPAVNDVLYGGGGTVCTATGFAGLTSDTLGGYNNGNVRSWYSGGCNTVTGPTNAGFVPASPDVMYIKRGFGYDSGQSADGGSELVGMTSAGAVPTTASVATAIAQFTPYLAPETNSSATTEIKAQTVQSPIAGLLHQARRFWSSNLPTASSNGCPATQYVVLVTDGLPTMDRDGKNWPPLGSTTATHYGVTATFNGDGSLAATNDQALTDTIDQLSQLELGGIKTYIIGLGAGVDPSKNPMAASTLTAMAVAGGTHAYFPATSPTDLTNDMQAILAQVLAATQSTSSATVNTTGLNTSSVAYQPSFDTADTDQDWTGDLKAYPIDPSTGVVNTSMLNWSAQAQLDIQDAGAGYDTGRIIDTWDPVAGAAIPFRWTGGTPAQGIGATTMLGQDLETNSADMSGQDALNYLRGDRALEIANGGPYRSRTHILGDIVDSAPLYVGAVVGPYQSSSYYAFEQAHMTRKPVLYLGANDGMLHAFDATTGNELFAYIPNGVYSNLIKLTNPYYNEQHQFFADGSAQASDVQFGDGSWHTELVSGERAGGSTVFALDVTDPASITTETALASKVLWEFSDADMGRSYSTPAIAQTAAGASASVLGFTVFFGNGYNSASQRPYLYALDPQSGSVRAKIDLCAAVPTACDLTRANGLSSVVVVNTIGGVSAAATALYAGDLQGNVWRVDISSATPASWVVSLLFQATDPSGARQPITTVPVISLNPDFPRLPGVMVYVGTGQMLGIPDLSSTQVQTMYGIYDSGTNPATLHRGDLEQQTMSPSGASLRIVTGGPITLPTQNGWYVDLSLLTGERFVTDPRIDSGAVVATTVQPATNTCNGGDVAWLMEFNYAGGTFVSPQFDTNGNGSLDAGDQVANGLLLGSVYAAAPVIVKTPCTTNCKRVKLITESSGAIKNIAERGAQQQRTAWWEIR